MTLQETIDDYMPVLKEHFTDDVENAVKRKDVLTAFNESQDGDADGINTFLDDCNDLKLTQDIRICVYLFLADQ